MALASVSPTVAGSKPKKLLDQTRDVLRLKHYSLRTERSYCDWIERCDDLRRPAVWLRECGFMDSTRGVTGRSDIARWDLQKRNNARRTGRTRALQWGLPRLKAE